MQETRDKDKNQGEELENERLERGFSFGCSLHVLCVEKAEGLREQEIDREKNTETYAWKGAKVSPKQDPECGGCSVLASLALCVSKRSLPSLSLFYRIYAVETKRCTREK